jgi:hypothetical protein
VIAGLFTISVEQARAAGLLKPDEQDDKTRLAACDSTGMEAGHVSYYFTHRSKQKKRKFPKFWAVVAAATHVCLAMVPGVGPSPDDPQFHRVAREAHAREPFKALAADVGFDGEHHHRYLYEKLGGVLGIIPPERGRPRKSKKNQRSGFFRQFIHEHWPRKLYGQRWQVETFFSMLKRLLDSYLRAMNWRSQHREMCLKVLTLNLMLIAAVS